MKQYFFISLIKPLINFDCFMNFQNKIFQSQNGPPKSNKSISQTSQKLSQKSQNHPISTFSSNLVLKNTQYLTNLQNYATLIMNFSQVQIENFFQAIDPGSLCRIIVQNMYLLQICYLFRLKVFLSLNFYVQKTKYCKTSHNVHIFQLYCFQAEINSGFMERKRKLAILQSKFIKLFEEQENRMQDFFYVLEKLTKMIELYFQCMQKSKKPQSSNNPETQQNKKYLSEFVKIYQNLIQSQKDRFNQPKFLLKLLEQTKLFRAHSLLVKIVNCSLFYSIKLFSNDLPEELKKSVKQIKQYFRYGSDQAKFQKPIVKLIDQFFTNLCRSNVIQITKSLKQASEEDDTMTSDILSLFEYDDIAISLLPTITASIMVRQQKYLQISQQLLDNILANFPLQNLQPDKDVMPPKNIQIQISYTYVNNEIKVKCITEIDVSIDNMDYLYYLITMFNKEMKSTLIIDTIQKFRKSMNKKVEKVIAFKLTYKAKPNEEPLTKILQLIDVGVLASKVFLTQLSKKSFIKLEDYQKRQKICEIFRHYENIFRNIMRKFYTEIQAQK